MGELDLEVVDLRLVFAYLCSDLFLDVGSGFPRARVP